jgi:isopentenyl phosphate kinase
MSKSKSFVFIKLGGSIITDKNKNSVIKTEQLIQLVNEIKLAKQELTEEIIVGHGSGSFAHLPAKKYKTKDGFISNNSDYGMALTQHKAAELNRAVVAQFLQTGLPAVSVAMSNCAIVGNSSKTLFLEVLYHYISLGLLPVTYGDVISHRQRGCTIWSTEEIFTALIKEFIQHGHHIIKVVHVTEIEGFLGDNHQVIPEINSDNWPHLSKYLGKTNGFDVTGGMKLKVEESLKLAHLGVTSIILSGLKKNNLYNCLAGKKYLGTLIH